MSLPASVQLVESPPGYPLLDIRHATCHAQVALNGAHLMEWTPAGQRPVLYLSPQAVLETGKPVRGGIPLCWPWFNAHPSDASKPMHGFARISPWTLMAATESEQGVKLCFALCSDAASLDLWPHAFECHLTLHLGTSLEVELVTVNRDSAPFELAEALHTYLKVGDIAQVTVRGLDDTDYLDTVGERTLRHQSGDITFDREVDRQYVSEGTVVVEDPAWNRKLVVEKGGSRTTVVWNPWIEKSKRLADLPDEAYLSFLCIEAANAGSAALTLAPGESHTLTTRVRVEA